MVRMSQGDPGCTIDTQPPPCPPPGPRRCPPGMTIGITAPMPWMTIGPTVAGCLKGALSGKLHADADGGPGDDGEVLDAVVDHLGLPGGEELHKDRSQAHPQDQKDHPADQIDEVAVGHYPVGLVGPVLPQPAGQQGVEAHAGAYAHGDHQGLDRVDKRQGYKPVGAELGHEHAVHQIIEGLDQHGQHHGPGHIQQQPAHRYDRHLVFLQSNSS